MLNILAALPPRIIAFSSTDRSAELRTYFNACLFVGAKVNLSTGRRDTNRCPVRPELL